MTSDYCGGFSGRTQLSEPLYPIVFNNFSHVAWHVREVPCITIPLSDDPDLTSRFSPFR